MRNKESWKPSKFIIQDGITRGSADSSELSIASRLSADNTASLLGDYINEYATGVLFDLGCGKVPLYEVYKDKVREIICTDWSISLHGSIHWDVIFNLNLPLPISNTSADTVILSSVLEHISKPELLIQEIHRILKVNGHLIMAVPFLYRIHEEPWDYYRFTKFGLQEMFLRNNFSVITIQETGGIFEVVYTSMMHFLYRGRLKLLFKLFYSFARMLVDTELFKKISKRTSDKFPLGYVMVVMKNEPPV